MVRLILNLILLIAIVLGVIYFLPGQFKIKQLERLADFVPESITEKTEAFLLTPAEKREKYIVQLEIKLAALKGVVSAETQLLIPEMEELIQKLKEENDELSFTELAKEKLVEQFLKKEATTTTVNQ